MDLERAEVVAVEVITELRRIQAAMAAEAQEYHLNAPSWHSRYPYLRSPTSEECPFDPCSAARRNADALMACILRLEERDRDRQPVACQCCGNSLGVGREAAWWACDPCGLWLCRACILTHHRQVHPMPTTLEDANRGPRTR